MRNNSFEKTDRLLKRTDYLRVTAEGRSLRNRQFIAVYNLNNRNNCRLGITVTKRTGGAVTRNRIKRQVREFFRRNREILTQKVDLNIIARQEAAIAKHERINEALRFLFQKITNEINH